MNPLNLEEIRDFIQQSLNINDVRISDDSHLHHSHQQFQSQKAYLTIYLEKVPNISRIKLHRTVMALAAQVCNQPIHAISIQTLKNNQAITQ